MIFIAEKLTVMLFQKNMDEKEEGQLGQGCCSHPSNHFQVHFRLGFDLIFSSFSMFGLSNPRFSTEK